MEHWDEVRTAYQVARIGTVSGAAEVLGVHHATVIRHIDALEGRLGVKLFQRHARGYTPTEAGRDLLQVAQATDDQFAQLAGRIRDKGDGVTGELVITSLVALSAVLAPALARFRQVHPEIRVRYLTGDRLFRLEYGEAHVAIRAGRQAPDQPDNVVQRFVPYDMRLAASKDYARRMGLPGGVEDFAEHEFVALDGEDRRPPFMDWLLNVVPRDRIVFRTSNNRSMSDAVIAGAGIGFLTDWEYAARDDLVEVMPPQDAWQSPTWLVTHVDLHRSPKVQAFLQFLKEESKGWRGETAA